MVREQFAARIPPIRKPKLAKATLSPATRVEFGAPEARRANYRLNGEPFGDLCPPDVQ
jgi:hypothetical protein